MAKKKVIDSRVYCNRGPDIAPDAERFLNQNEPVHRAMNRETKSKPRMDADFFSKYLQSPRIEPDIYIPAPYLKKSVIYYNLGSTLERMLFILIAKLIQIAFFFNYNATRTQRSSCPHLHGWGVCQSFCAAFVASKVGAPCGR
jgi:hypothetical protein